MDIRKIYIVKLIECSNTLEMADNREGMARGFFEF